MRNQHFRRSRIRYLYLFSILFSVLLTKTSCKKTDVLLKQQTIVVEKYFGENNIGSRNFFQNSENSSPLAKKVAQALKQANEKKDFVTEFAQKNGVPIWEKALIDHKREATRESVGNGNDTIMYIALVIPNTNKVNGFLRVAFRDSVHINYYLCQDYKNYAQNNTPNQTLKNHFTIFNMMLDNMVFGYTTFSVNDYVLFNDNPSTTNTKSVKIKRTFNQTQNNNTNSLVKLVAECAEIEVLHEDPLGVDCPPGSACQWTTTETVCTYSWTWLPDVGGGNFNYENAPQNLPGGGANGGNGIPHAYPCNPNIPPPVLPDPLPPCPIPAAGIGWTPLPLPPKPCEVVDSLMKTNNFPLYFSTLRNQCNLSYEKGYLFSDPFAPNTTYEEVSGTPNKLNVDIFPTVPVDGIIHNHYDDTSTYSVFSFDDLWRLFYIYKNNKIKDTHIFTYSVVTRNTSYILMINNLAAFEAFGNSIVGLAGCNEDQHDMVSKYYYDVYKISPQNTNTQNEVAFLTYIKEKSAGIKVFKGNNGMTGFSPITLNNNNEVVADNCN